MVRAAPLPNSLPGWVRILDHGIALCIGCPLVALVWCGGFFLTDFYVFPNERPLNFWLTFVTGKPAIYPRSMAGRRRPRDPGGRRWLCDKR